MMHVILFLITFGAGPALFWVLARRRADRSYFAALCATATLLALAALGLPGLLGRTPATGAAVIMMLWIGWVMVLTLCVLALRARIPDPVVSKAAFTLGAMATTLPWFGLYTAQMIDG